MGKYSLIIKMAEDFQKASFLESYNNIISYIGKLSSANPINLKTIAYIIIEVENILEDLKLYETAESFSSSIDSAKHEITLQMKWNKNVTNPNISFQVNNICKNSSFMKGINLTQIVTEISVDDLSEKTKTDIKKLTIGMIHIIESILDKIIYPSKIFDSGEVISVLNRELEELRYEHIKDIEDEDEALRELMDEEDRDNPEMLELARKGLYF